MTTKCKYMKGAEFKARQTWLPFVDAAGVVLRILEEVKESAADWFKVWVKDFRTTRIIHASEQLSFSFSATLEKVRCAQNC